MVMGPELMASGQSLGCCPLPTLMGEKELKRESDTARGEGAQGSEPALHMQHLHRAGWAFLIEG